MAQGMVMGEKVDPKIAALEAQIAEMKALLLARVESPAYDAGVEAVKVLAQQSAPKEERHYNEIGPFTYPEGQLKRPKPKLSRPTFFGGSRQREDDLTPAEIEAFNAIVDTREARDGRWKAEVRQNGSAKELWVDVPVKTLDDRISLPSLLMILIEMQGGAKAADPAALAQRVADLEAKLAAVA